MALDWGTSRIGVAMSDETQLVATPAELITRRASKRLPLGPFLTLVEQHMPVGLVVGLPLDDDGLEGDSALQARAMGETFAERAGLPLDWIDESFTTAETLKNLIHMGVGRDQRRFVDARAAATMLQQWLDARRDSRR